MTYVHAGSWLMALVWTVLTSAISSTHLGRVRQQLADPHAALAVLRELEDRRSDRQPRLPAGHGRDALSLADAVGEVLVEVLGQSRLVIPQILLRGPAVHVQIDQVLGLGREVRQARQRGWLGRSAGSALVRLQAVRAQHPQGESTQSNACGAEEIPAGQHALVLVQRMHVSNSPSAEAVGESRAGAVPPRRHVV
jgi:hypothetical protein